MKMTARKLIHPIVRQLALHAQPFEVVQENRPITAPNKPIIYAANHSFYPDGPVMSAVVPHWSLLLAGKQRLNLAGKLFFWLNGTIWVNRKDKTDMKRAKETIIRCLQAGKDLIWFPEATWNVTESQLMLPMRWGIIEAAHKADAQIVPVALHYDRERMEVHIRWGDTMDGRQLEDKAAGIRDLRDKLAALRWEFWERDGVTSRADLDIDEARRKNSSIYTEYMPLSIADEQSAIFQPCPLRETVFPAEDRLRLNNETAFLFSKKIHD